MKHVCGSSGFTNGSGTKYNGPATIISSQENDNLTLMSE